MKEARCHDIKRKGSWRDALKHICLIQNESKKINIARGRLYKGDRVVERERMREKNSHGENVRSEDVTQTLLHTDVFTHKRSYAETLLHTDVFTHTEAFIHRFQSHTRTHTLLHTLAQNCHCEFCCGVHLTCKNNPVTPDTGTEEQKGVWCGVEGKFFRRHLEEWNKINRS